MNTRVLMGAVALCSVTVVVTAQAQTGAQKPRDKASNATVTVQGCLERSPGAGMAGTATGAASSAGAASFLLMPIATPVEGRRAAADAAQTPGPGVLGGGTVAGMQSPYRLEADASVLNAHVGHKVELTGVVDERVASVGMPSAAGAPVPAESMHAPTLKVRGVKMVASTCMGG